MLTRTQLLRFRSSRRTLPVPCTKLTSVVSAIALDGGEGGDEVVLSMLLLSIGMVDGVSCSGAELWLPIGNATATKVCGSAAAFYSTRQKTFGEIITTSGAPWRAPHFVFFSF